MMFGTATQVSDVQQAVMCLSVTAGNAAAIETELHVEILDTDVVNQLIETALQESRIDRANRLESFTRHARGKRDAVLLGNADVEGSIGKLLERFANAGAVRHRGSQRDDLRILLHQLAKHIAKYRRVSRGFENCFDGLSGFQIEWPGCMPTIVVRFVPAQFAENLFLWSSTHER